MLRIGFDAQRAGEGSVSNIDDAEPPPDGVPPSSSPFQGEVFIRLRKTHLFLHHIPQAKLSWPGL